MLKDGTVIFRKDEVDEDGEIPAPYCYWKNGCADMPEGNAMPDENTHADDTDEEDLVEKEFQKL